MALFDGRLRTMAEQQQILRERALLELDQAAEEVVGFFQGVRMIAIAADGTFKMEKEPTDPNDQVLKAARRQYEIRLAQLITSAGGVPEKYRAKSSEKSGQLSDEAFEKK